MEELLLTEDAKTIPTTPDVSDLHNLRRPFFIFIVSDTLCRQPQGRGWPLRRPDDGALVNG